jgi:hypothetical protein
MIHIWIRTSIDWTDEEAFWAQVPDRFRPRAELWNATIDMPFHVFRHRVQKIAELNLSRVANAVVSGWDAIPDGARVVPVDDDDWFAPDLASALERQWGDASGVHWNPMWIGVPSDFPHWRNATRRRLLPFTRPHWTCDTNNYAVVKQDGARELCGHHFAATSWFDGPGRDSVRRIGGWLSVNNRTLGSQTSLRPTHRGRELTRERLLRRLARYRRLYRRPRGPAWCHPYLAMMAALMDELRAR